MDPTPLKGLESSLWTLCCLTRSSPHPSSSSSHLVPTQMPQDDVDPFSVPARVSSALAYPFFIPWALLLLLKERDSDLIRFHCRQALIIGLGLFVPLVIVTNVLNFTGLGAATSWMYLVYAVVLLGLVVIGFVAYRQASYNEIFRIPGIANLADRWAGTNNFT